MRGKQRNERTRTSRTNERNERTRTLHHATSHHTITSPPNPTTPTALDLDANTQIAIFSCYSRPELANPPRKLIVQSKEDGITVEIPLTHNSVVVFSLDANRRHRHKIVLDGGNHSKHSNEWLGITFRTSKTLVQYRDGAAYFEDGSPLTVFTESQRGGFYQLRGRETILALAPAPLQIGQ